MSNSLRFLATFGVVALGVSLVLSSAFEGSTVTQLSPQEAAATWGAGMCNLNVERKPGGCSGLGCPNVNQDNIIMGAGSFGLPGFSACPFNPGEGETACGSHNIAPNCS